MTSDQIIANLEQLANAQAIEGMARFGIRPAQALGISIPTLRKMAKDIGRNQALALALWDSGIHEARILASMIAEPQLVSAELMEEWVNDFDAWDVCDQVCGNLFDKTPYAYQKAKEWCQQEKEFVRRVFGWRLDIFRLQNCLDEFIGPGGDFHFQGFWERSRRCFVRVHRPRIDFL